MALAARLSGAGFRVFALLSDGENNEGSVWEAAMFAAAQKLTNLCVIVDYNKWQATARSDETLQLAPLARQVGGFGWDAHEIDGHDVGALARQMESVPNGSGKPVALIAHTDQGQGRVLHGGRQQLALSRADRRGGRLARAELGLA